MAITVQGPGDVSIEFPDGTDAATIDGVMRQQFGGTPPVAPVSRETLPSVAMNAVEHGSDLTKRAIVQATPTAVFGLPALAMDAADAAINLGGAGYNKIAPSMGLPAYTPYPTWKYSQATSDVGRMAADALGLDKPTSRAGEAGTEAATAGLGALMGAGGGAGLAKSLAGAGERAGPLMGKTAGIVKDALRELSQAPTLQAAGAVGGLAATDAAREAGLDNPYALSGVALMGSIAGGSGVQLGERAGIGAKSAFVDPFTNPGKEIIAGTVLNKLAANPLTAAQNLMTAGPIVPGSLPTLSQASRDPGLIAAERPLMTAVGGDKYLAERLAQQNLARQGALDNISMQPSGLPVAPRGSLDYATAKRNRTVGEEMKPAFAGASAFGLADPGGALGKIDEILASPVGARSDVQKAMKFARERLTQENVNLNDPETLYSVRKDLNDAKMGVYDKTDPSLRLAKGQLSQVINSLDASLDAAAPGYQRYMDLYSARSVPLGQTKTINAIREAGSGAVSDRTLVDTGTRILQPGKFQNALRKSIAMGALEKARLSDTQISVMQNVADDLDRGAAAQTSTIKAPGSDTFRNFTVANMLGRIVGKNFPDTPLGKGFQTLGRGFEWIYSMPDEAVKNLLTDATLNPELASRMMRAASKAEMEHIGGELAKKAALQAYTQPIHSNKN